MIVTPDISLLWTRLLKVHSTITHLQPHPSERRGRIGPTTTAPTPPPPRRRTVRHQCYYRARATIHSHTSTSFVKQRARCTDLIQFLFCED